MPRARFRNLTKEQRKIVSKLGSPKPQASGNKVLCHREFRALANCIDRNEHKPSACREAQFALIHCRNTSKEEQTMRLSRKLASKVRRELVTKFARALPK